MSTVPSPAPARQPDGDLYEQVVTLNLPQLNATIRVSVAPAAAAPTEPAATPRPNRRGRPPIWRAKVYAMLTQSPKSLGQVVEDLREAGIEAPHSSVAEALHWLTDGGLAERLDDGWVRA
jgi:hypothetical protein